MFNAVRSRKRGRRALADGADADAAKPLRDVVACLTGFPSEEKERIHLLIQELGGRYTRDLNSTQNTHLIASVPEGAKYETARSFPHMQIVKPAWLDACARDKARVPESSHHLAVVAGDGSGMDDGSTNMNATNSDKLQSLSEALKSPGMVERRDSTLFSSCHFYLVGFEVDSDLYLSLCRWIRRGLGTIYWEISPSISHIIVNDNCDESIREATRVLRLQHPNCPVSVSPMWIVSCWKDDKLHAPGNFAPQYQAAVLKEEISKKELNKPTNEEKTNSKAASLFRGSVFVMLRVAPPVGAVDFDSQQIEQSIRTHAGQMLSLKLLEALKVDRRAAAKDKDKNISGSKRKCFVVCWGHTGHTASQLTIHPLLSQVRRHNLCELVQVTPVWLKTCCSEDKVVGVDRCPFILSPQKWPIQSLVVENGNNNDGGFAKEKKGSKGSGGSSPTGSKLRISVTGFSGSRRSAMIHLIQAMGATYDDSMRTSTTHLIFRERLGPKYEKALEWKLHVVTIDWLYHIAEYGYSGKSGKKGFGCESRFSLDSANEDASVEC